SVFSMGKFLGDLSLNEKVKIINPTIISAANLIEVQISLTYDPIVKSEKYFINIEKLSPKKIDYKEFIGKYFVVVNVATETLRLYERLCMDNSCPNKMLLESEVVVGEDVNHPKEEKGKGRSVLGSYRVTGWSKFYQDPEGHYPSWYKAGYPDAPGPDASWNEWFSNQFMPIDAEGKSHGTMRGAFGWYTAFVAPEPFGQWTHGTLGWGSDKDKFIKKVKKPLINIVSDPRSSGCTRNNNEAIAFIRKLIDVGAPIIKIYAKEEILDPTLTNYPIQSEEWKYVLTKNRNHAIDREEVLKILNITPSDLDTYWEAKRGDGALVLDPTSPLNQILEVGTYEHDAHPDAIAYTPGEKLNKFTRKLGRKGNVYGIKSSEMHGAFYVDAGVLSDYGHPDSVLEVSGFSDEMTPPWMKHSNLK
ncbi:MAG: L,D-transpeptidase, partial [Bacteriovorax sp.]|nr:L,D-transpeptidase [Bacteriovorax sp.]